MEEIYKNLDLNNLEGEEWRDIPNYEGLYQVSNMGRVKSLKDNNGKYREKILSQFLNNKNGYLYVQIYKEGKVKTCTVHRLVGNAFIPNPSNLPTVNHIDENKENNCVNNLEWMNYSQQQRHGTCQQRISEKLTNRQVYQYDKNHNLIKIWQSTAEAGRNGFDQGNISKCCRNCFNREGNNVYKNYIWSYTEIN